MLRLIPRQQINGCVKGFTLVEVLSGFVIFALAFSTILQVLSSALRMTGGSEEYAQAMFFAESKLAALGTFLPMDSGYFEGEFGNGMRWQLHVTPYQPGYSDTVLIGDKHELGSTLPASYSDPGFQLFLVQLQVFWRQEKRNITLSTLRFGLSDKLGAQ
ncbi:MAG: hypothetical protein ACFHVJ_11915 [Aestuariibacter sp.]